jgi:hypothetical protein
VAAYVMRHKTPARAVLPDRNLRLSSAAIIDTGKQDTNILAMRYPKVAPQARYR